MNLPELQKLTFNVDFNRDFHLIVKAPYVFSPLNARATTLIALAFWNSRAEGTGFFGVEQGPHQTYRPV
jgi:hypothetical protein